jgi:NAD kinase
MRTPTHPRFVLVTRPTRLAELVVRFNTVAQARFVLERLGADFDDYRAEDERYGTALAETRRLLARLGRVVLLDRKFLPAFLFGAEDVVVVLGQDGLVANTLKYLDGQPVLGVNPDPRRWDGRLLPFSVADLSRVLPETLAGRRPTRAVTMAQATLHDGQKLLAVNDLFVGLRNHGSARYRIQAAGQAEDQSSSGVIVSTGLGSTGWLRSLLAGAWALTRQAAVALALPEPGRVPPVPGRASSPTPAALARVPALACHEPDVGRPAWLGGLPSPAATVPTWAEGSPTVFNRPAAFAAPVLPAPPAPQVPWDTDCLYFTVREPFPSRTTGASIVFGRITAAAPLHLQSQTAENGVIFSDGVEQDYLPFNAGTRVTITLAPRQGTLVV